MRELDLAFVGRIFPGETLANPAHSSSRCVQPHRVSTIFVSGVDEGWRDCLEDQDGPQTGDVGELSEFGVENFVYFVNGFFSGHHASYVESVSVWRDRVVSFYYAREIYNRTNVYVYLAVPLVAPAPVPETTSPSVLLPRPAVPVTARSPARAAGGLLVGTDCE